MILVDPRIGSGVGAGDLQPLIKARGVQCEKSPLEFGDACFEGNGPKGRILVGLERKKLPDMLDCIESARYAGHQRPGMSRMYHKSFLILEGVWAPGTPPNMDGLLIVERPNASWGPYNVGGRSVLYSKLYRYLLSVSMTGVIITFSRNVNHTAFNIVECYHYFQKKWADHTSMLQTQQLNVPALDIHPPLVRRWAAEVGGVGVKLSQDAERLFKKPITLATADEIDWMKIPGIGAERAKQVVREIQGWRDR